MKVKFLFPILISVLIGTLFGKIILNQYSSSTTVAKLDGEKLYFIKLDDYKNIDEIKEKHSDYSTLIYIKNNNIYSLYSGISLSKKIAQKIQGYYLKSYNNTTIEEKVESNEEFITMVKEYDKLLETSTLDNDIKDIEKIVLSNYKELIIEE